MKKKKSNNNTICNFNVKFLKIFTNFLSMFEGNVLRQFCPKIDKWNPVTNDILKLKSHKFDKNTYTLKVFIYLLIFIKIIKRY